MSKKNKNKKRVKRRKTKEPDLLNPKVFLKKIGLRPFIPSISQTDHTLRTRFGNEIADNFKDATKNNDNQRAWYVLHKSLGLAKLRYGNDFDILCKILTELKDIPIVQNPRVLDIGGAAGSLAFYLANAWNVSELLVADKYKSLGEEWAEEIGERRVKFVNATLPNLNIRDDKNFDVILLSRVLYFIEGLNISNGIEALSYEEYMGRDEGKFLFSKLEHIAEELFQYLSPNGIIVIVNSWSDELVRLVGRAFERKGLFIDLDYFKPEDVSDQHSVIVFSKRTQKIAIKDIPLALASKIMLGEGGVEFKGVTAETVRNLFDDIEPTALFEYEYSDENDIVVFEVLEKDGLSLIYNTITNGVRKSIISSAILIPQHIANLQQTIEENKCKITMLREYICPLTTATG